MATFQTVSSKPQTTLSSKAGTGKVYQPFVVEVQDDGSTFVILSNAQGTARAVATDLNAPVKLAPGMYPMQARRYDGGNIHIQWVVANHPNANRKYGFAWETKCAALQFGIQV